MSAPFVNQGPPARMRGDSDGMSEPGVTVDTIDEVLEALDTVVARALERGSRLGYFAAIYRKVTARIAEGIATGYFDDGERMDRFDVAFAQRYLAAVDGHEDGGTPLTRSWELAVRAATASRPLILQHLLVAINAHVNLDLGISAAATAPGRAIFELRRDFDRVNEILASLIADVERDLSQVSPWIGLLDRVGGRHDEEVIRFSIEVARTEAWRFAVELAPLARDQWAGPIRARDVRVAHVARAILKPGWLTAALLVIRARESNDVRHNIEVLGRVEAPGLERVEARVEQERALGRVDPATRQG
jgi:hypothetical protein